MVVVIPHCPVSQAAIASQVLIFKPPSPKLFFLVGPPLHIMDVQAFQQFIPFDVNSRSTTDIIARMADPKERFYRHFQTEITAIQDQIEVLGTLSPVAGERQDCIDTILTGISRLSNEVTDALDYVPAYDQRAYSQALKALTEKLNETTGKFAPRSRFQFKPRIAAQQGPADAPVTKTYPNASSGVSSSSSRFGSGVAGGGRNDVSAVADNDEERDSVSGLPKISGGKNYNEELSRPSSSTVGVRKPSFSNANTIAIYEHEGLHISLPATASHATSAGSLTTLDRCIVDMTIPTMTKAAATADQKGTPFATLAIKNVKNSLLVCGTVAGAVHITSAKDSIIVVAAQQVRMHECHGVDVYLYCGSHPIIEDCKDIRFAPLPECYISKTDLDARNNQWDQVHDFKWLKSEPSPNWAVMPEADRVPEEVWTKAVCGNPSYSTDDILRKVGLLKP